MKQGMTDRPKEPLVERSAAFLERLRRWAEPRHDLRALVVVGSVARGDARPDSDVDVVLLADRREAYLATLDWTADFGPTRSIALEEYGRVTSVRAFYGDGLEVEFSIAPADWASVPLDAGTERVAQDGFVVIMDRDGHAIALQAALRSAKPRGAGAFGRRT
jgi:uncharacterized protein